MTTSTDSNGKTTTTTTTSSSNTNQQLRPPLVLWAQRADKLFLTIELEDCKNPNIILEKDKLYFKGKSDSIQQDADHSEHEVTIEFYKPVNDKDSKHSVRARGTEFVIMKEENSWWPRLLKDSTKQHWLKVDFPKWKDEDDSDDEAAGPAGMAGQPDFRDLMQQFGGMDGGGMGGMGGFGGAGPEGDESDGLESDDDETEQSPPDLEG